MKAHFITFDRLEADYNEIGKIRSVTVDHERRIVRLVCDEKEEDIEGQTIPQGITFTTQYDETKV